MARILAASESALGYLAGRSVRQTTFIYQSIQVFRWIKTTKNPREILGFLIVIFLVGRGQFVFLVRRHHAFLWKTRHRDRHTFLPHRPSV